MEGDLQQQSLFSTTTEKITVINRDGMVNYFPEFLNKEEARILFLYLKNQIAWQQRSIKLFGRNIKQPRLIFFAAEQKLYYRYSGDILIAAIWDERIKMLSQKLTELTDSKFNSVLLNYYRNGLDSMGWHADNEPELGQCPTIASVTLGDERPFKFRHKDGETIALMPASGSLLMMSGELQSHWKHALPKKNTLFQQMGRINLTFRYIG